ncbi:MAG TPA: tetratricopeptide repeat protein [Bryobacteraceae bacterium]|nr:tetratricopeptide repeat protein [Bryobacteraceae bacterium]
MNFWRQDVVQFALSQETLLQIEEQREWILREPGNARPYYNLAQLYRIEGRNDEALGLLLEAVRLQDNLHVAHVSLSEIYAIRADYPAAWRHARAAERCGVTTASDLLKRYGVPER